VNRGDAASPSATLRALGRVGVWTYQLDLQPAPVARETAAELEELGFASIWLSDSVRRELFSNASLILNATKNLSVATGIANIYSRDALTMAFGQKTIAEAFPGRFVLGLGVGHRAAVEGLRGHRYDPPIATMRHYLQSMAMAPYQGPRPSTGCPTILAALGPKMIELARDLADGIHPYHTTPEHTKAARQILGDEAFLAPEQSVVFETDPGRARAIARSRLKNTLTQPNYLRNLARLGFSSDDLSGTGSDYLIDNLVAWGKEEAIAGRIKEHLDAGADHVAVQILVPDDRALPFRQWRMLASVLSQFDAPIEGS
jgi:probable F420-dependent oxidoreductase